MSKQQKKRKEREEEKKLKGEKKSRDCTTQGCPVKQRGKETKEKCKKIRKEREKDGKEEWKTSKRERELHF